MSNRYSLYPASFVHGGGTLTLGQMGGATVAVNGQYDEITPGGAVDRGAVVLQTASPSCNLQSSDLANIFATLSPTVGLSCTGTCKLQYQKRADQGVFAGGSTNGVATATKGFLFPTTLTAGNSGRAMLSMQFIPLFDGTNEPLVFSSLQALTGTAAFNSCFYHGPCYVNGVLIDGLLNVSVDFGIQTRLVYENGSVFPTLVSVVDRRPTISLTFSKLENTSGSIGSLFTGGLAGAVAVYFQKGVPSGKRVAPTGVSNDVHCKISAASGQWNADDLSSPQEDDATVTIIVRPTAALSVSVASFIP